MLHLDPLEPRRLLTSISDVSSWENGTQTFSGTSKADVLTFSVFHSDFKPFFGAVQPQDAGYWLRFSVNDLSSYEELLPDSFNGSIGKVIIDGRRGDDQIVFDAGAWAAQIPLTINGGAGNDTIVGSTSAEQIFAGEGNDIVNGADGRDTIYGEAGDDSIRGGGSSDLIDGVDGADTLRGDAGNDRLSGGANPDRLRGSLGNDTLDGGGGRDLLAGEDGDDSLLGGSGDDVCDGGAGDDFLSGGSGNDLCFGHSGHDRGDDIGEWHDPLDVIDG